MRVGTECKESCMRDGKSYQSVPDKLKGLACPKLKAGVCHLRDFRQCTVEQPRDVNEVRVKLPTKSRYTTIASKGQMLGLDAELKVLVESKRDR